VSRPRRVPLPAPFDNMKWRRKVCMSADVCDSTLCKWASGDQKISVHFCRSIVLAIQGLGVFPPLGAKLPPAQAVIVDAGETPLRVVS